MLYPYVYLLARAAFLEPVAHAARGRARARALARAGRSCAWALPLARPAILGGVALALMEALADFGTVNLLGVRTFTDAIYRVWFNAFDREAAMQFAMLLVSVTLTLLVLERLARGRARHAQVAARGDVVPPVRLRGRRRGSPPWSCRSRWWVSWSSPRSRSSACGRCSRSTRACSRPSSPPSARNSVLLSGMSAILVPVVALLLAYGVRASRSRTAAGAARTATIGYGLPGSVVAVAVIVPLGWLERRIDGVLGTGLLLTGTVIGLFYAYVVRFLALAWGAIEASLMRIPRQLDDAARGLGADRLDVLARVHVPLLRTGLVTAALLVFVEVMKELPATLLLRPLGGDTLAIAVWQATHESLYKTAALPALLIVLVGLLPVALMIRLSGRAAPRGRGLARRWALGRGARGGARMSHVRVRGLSKSFGAIEAVRELNLEIERGELMAVLGPSGCGKTTLLRVIAGFEQPDAGCVVVSGDVVAGPGRIVPPEKRRVGMVFQDYALFPHLSVEGNVAFGLANRPREERDSLTRRTLELVGLQHKARTGVHELSGGERQRVALARALAPEPELVLLDEPFSSLDATLRAGLRREVELILRDAEATALLVTHDQEEALSLADRLAVMRDGEIVQVGPPVEVYGAPATRWAAQFVGEVNVLAGVARGGGVETELGVFDLRVPRADPCTWRSVPSSSSCARRQPQRRGGRARVPRPRRALPAAPRGRQGPPGAAAVAGAARGGRQRVRPPGPCGRAGARGLGSLHAPIRLLGNLPDPASRRPSLRQRPRRVEGGRLEPRGREGLRLGSSAGRHEPEARQGPQPHRPGHGPRA